MKTILVTGADGFIGKNLCSHLSYVQDTKILKCYKNNFHQILENNINDIDFIYHLAGTNRSNLENDFKKNNVDNTDYLVACLKKFKNKAPIVYASTTKVNDKTIYALTKKKAEDILIEHSRINSSKISILRLPNIFGKWSKPNYNSFVSTVIYNIINNKKTSIWDGEKEIELFYIDDLIEILKNLFLGLMNFSQVLENFKVYRETPNNLLKIFTCFLQNRESKSFDLNFNEFEKKLYSTFISNLDIEKSFFFIESNKDKRGDFIEFLKSPLCGQVSGFYSKNQISRGDHFHHTKVERFLILSGKARFRFKNIISNEKYEKIISYTKPCIVETFPGWAHSIDNIGTSLLSGIIWSNEHFDKFKPDTYHFEGDM